MSSLTIRNIPEPVLERLRQSARANRRSLNSEALHRLERSLEAAPIDAEEFLERTRPLREKTSLMPLTDEILRRAKEEGRA